MINPYVTRSCTVYCHFLVQFKLCGLTKLSRTEFHFLWPSIQPYDHSRVVARFHLAGPEQIQQAIDSAMQARVEWEKTPFEDR